MRTSNKGISLIKKWESFSPVAYRCSAGILTIGYGHTENVSIGDAISEQTALNMLKNDLESREQQLNDLRLTISQKKFDACMSFIFNLGFGSFYSSTLLKKIKINPADLDIASEFIKWIKINGTPARGLLLRRLDEAGLYFGN